MSRLAIWTINGALFVLCCFLSASLVNGWLSEWLAGPPPSAPAARVAEALPARDWADRQKILERNLFQASTLLPAEPVVAEETSLEEQLEATRLPLRLLGTVASQDPKEAWAAVEDTQRRKHLIVRPQDRLVDQATVVRIERRRIVLENRGKREELVLDEDEVGTPVRPVSTAAAQRSEIGDLRERVQRLGDGSFQVQRDDVQEAMRNPAELFTQARMIPKYEGQDMVGVQINGIQPGSLWEQIGIRDGDVVTSVNGIEVARPQDSNALIQQLTQSNEFQVEVMGSDGQTRSLNYVVEP
jgi:general secretion pathway protein C